MKKKIIGIALAVCMIGTCLVGCTYGNGNASVEKEYTAKIQNQISDAIGKPDISNFFEYGQLKDIYELRDDPNLICYWYTKNDMNGKFVYQGQCIGYGIPYGASITAPEIPDYSSYEDNASLCQAEPNGLYNNGMSTSATWVLTVDSEGNTKPTYVESEITVSQTKIDKTKCEEWSIPSDY